MEYFHRQCPPNSPRRRRRLLTRLGRNPLASWATIVDCGDAHLTWLDKKVAIERLDKAHKVGHLLLFEREELT